MNKELTVWRLGRVEYEDGLRLQALFGEARRAEKIGDVLLLLEHSPVLTLGRAGKPENIVASPARLSAMGVEVFRTNRGGDVTYHGPGQVVGYPIFKLPGDRHDVRRYVNDVEEAMVRTAADFGVVAGRIPKWTGVWLGEETSPDARKLAAIGVHLSRWQTSHGFAFNVNTDLAHFGLIVPCGIREKGVTSLARELGHPVPMGEVENALARHLGALFGARLIERTPQQRTVSVVVTRGVDRQQVLLLRRTAERGGFWQLVTGKLEPGEFSIDAATRELTEETGLTLPVAPLDYVHSFAFGDAVPPAIIEETAFVAPAPDEVSITLSEEHDAFEWVRVDEALRRLPFAGLKAAVRRAAQTAPPR